MAINPQKLLPPSQEKGGSLAKVSSSNLSLNISTKKIDTEKLIGSKDGENKLEIILKKIITIDALLKSSLSEDKKNENKKRKEKENADFKKEEQKLEAPKETKKFNLPSLSVPGMGFLDRIKRFIFFTALGWLFTKFQDQLPKLLGIVKIIGGVYNVAENIFKFLLETFVNFIDRGYKVYDKTREIVKSIGGEKAEKEFDNLSGKLNEYINYVLIGGMALTGAIKGFNSQSKKVVAKVTEEATKKAAGAAARTAGKVSSGAAGKVGGKLAVRQLLRLAKGPLTKLPIIGGLIEFGLSAALGDPLGKAAFRGVGTVLLGAVGSVILPGFGTFVGGWAGAELAAKLYEVLFENKKPTASVQKKAGGGPVTRGGVSINRPIGRTSATQQNSRKKKKLIAQPSKPGKNVGGEKKIKKLYPNSGDPLSVTEWLNLTDANGDPIGGTYEDYKNRKEKEKNKPNPYKALTDTSKILKKGGEAGILMAAGVDLAMGQELDTNFSNAFSKDTLLKSKVNEVIQNIKKELSKKIMGGGREASTEMPDGGGVGDATNAGKVFNAFVAEGFTTNQAAGVVGNLMQESGGGTKNLDPTAHNEIRNGHYGIAQWDKVNRWPAVSAYIRSIGKDPNSIDGQIAGLIWELKTKEKKAYAALKKATSAEQAAIVWLKEFERSGEVAGQSGFDNRILNASRISKEFATTGFNGTVDSSNPILSKLGSSKAKLENAGDGRCTTSVIDTMKANGVATPGVTGGDPVNPRGLIVQLMTKYGWKSLPIGSAVKLSNTYGTVTAHQMSHSQYENAVNNGKVPSGALVFQTQHNSWDKDAKGSSGFDSAIAQNGGKNLWNGRMHGTAIYRSVQKVIVLVPGGSIRQTPVPTTTKPGQPPSLTSQDKIEIQRGTTRTFSQLSEQSKQQPTSKEEPNWLQRLLGLGGNKPQPTRLIPPPREFLGFDGKMYTANFGTNEITDEKGNLIEISNKKYTRIREDLKNAIQGRRNMGLQGGGLIGQPNRRNVSSLSSYPSYDSGGGMMLAIQPIIIEKPVPIPSGGNKTIMFPVLVGVNNSNRASLSRG
jgi:hypothetical protein